MAEPRNAWVPVGGLRLHIRDWEGCGCPFVLVHGLASNCLTWEAVARQLHAGGHRVVSVDLRGHGLSDKPATGYGFAEVTSDLEALIEALGIAQPPILAGQSWGGAVVLHFAARYPGACSGLILVDGGYGQMSARPGATWERISKELRPPPLEGMPRDELVARMRRHHPDWTDEGIEQAMGNFEVRPDGTVRPWLSLDRHMQVLRALWEHNPGDLYPHIEAPVLIAPAGAADAERMRLKEAGVRQAQAALARCRVHWFPNTDHDIHIHRPAELATVILEAVQDGFFS